MSIDPSEESAQLILFEINDDIVIDVGSLIKIESENIHPLYLL